MIFGNDRNELRQMYVSAWRKKCAGEVLSPLESQIAQVIEEHPEYQGAMTDDKLDESYTPDAGQTNPFLHMGLHLAVREQIATDRPAGVAALFRDILAAAGDRHAAEHRVLDCLAEALWAAQASNALPDEAAYLRSLRRILG